jgi:hypothetical protein
VAYAVRERLVLDLFDQWEKTAPADALLGPRCSAKKIQTHRNCLAAQDFTFGDWWRANSHVAWASTAAEVLDAEDATKRSAWQAVEFKQAPARIM